MQTNDAAVRPHLRALRTISLALTTLVFLGACSSTSGPSQETQAPSTRASSPQSTDAEAALPGSASEVLAAAGYPELLEQLPRAMLAGLSASLPPGAKQLVERMEREIDARYDQQALIAAAAAELAQRATDDDLSALSAWYGSALAREITAGEVEGNNPDAMADMAATGPALLRDAERVALAQRIVESSGSLDVALAMQQEAAAAAMLMVSQNAPAGGDVDLAAARDHLEEQAPMMRMQLSQAMLIGVLYSQRTIATPDMARYAEFLETPASRTLVDVVNDGVRTASRTMIEAMVDVMEEVLRKSQKGAA